MKAVFNSQKRLIHATVKIHGTIGYSVFQFAIDTGSSRTVAAEAALLLLGYDPSHSAQRLNINTVAGAVTAPLISVRGISALGCARSDFDILCHTLPVNTGVDGLLGLDFFQDRRLTIDFPNSTIELV